MSLQTRSAVRWSSSFGKTIEGKWLASNCYKYGFTIRYPKEKEDITGYSYEPWHIRYVGKNLAKRLYKKKLTLEEYYQTTTVDKKVKPEDQVKDTDTGAPKEPQMTSAPTPNPSYKPKKTPKPSKSCLHRLSRLSLRKRKLQSGHMRRSQRRLRNQQLRKHRSKHRLQRKHRCQRRHQQKNQRRLQRRPKCHLEMK